MKARLPQLAGRALGVRGAVERFEVPAGERSVLPSVAARGGVGSDELLAVRPAEQ